MKKIGLGLMRLAKLNVEEAEQLILCALENDIQLFDHADIYGSRKCEQIFGEVLKRNPKIREKMIIQSKCGICRGYYRPIGFVHCPCRRTMDFQNDQSGRTESIFAGCLPESHFGKR